MLEFFLLIIILAVLFRTVLLLIPSKTVLPQARREETTAQNKLSGINVRSEQKSVNVIPVEDVCFSLAYNAVWVLELFSIGHTDIATKSNFEMIHYVGKGKNGALRF